MSECQADKSRILSYIGILRYSVYVSVSLVLSSAACYGAVHAYVEYGALHGRSPITLSEDNDSLFLLQDLVPGYSGAHLGGGTDPSIGWKARNAARAAWIALNLQKGGIASGDKAGNALIAVPDKAWLQAERYLVYALQQIALRLEGNRNDPITTESKWELMLRLAEVRSKLGGIRGLGDARRDYQAVLTEMREDRSLIKDSAGRARILDVARLLAVVEFRISRNSSGAKFPSGFLDREAERALVQLTCAVEETLNMRSVAEIVPDTADSIPSLAPQKACCDKQPLIAEVEHAVSSKIVPKIRNLLIKSHSTIDSSSGPVIRALVKSVMSLSASLTALGDLPGASALTSASLQYLEQLPHSPSRSETEGGRLQTAWIAVRRGMLNTYAAELSHAHKIIGVQPDELLENCVQVCRDTLTSLNLLASSLFARAHPLADFAISLSHTAQTSGALAAYARGLLFETSLKDNKMALDSHETALTFIATSSQYKDEEKAVLQDRIVEAIRRCRERVLNADR